MGKSTTHKDALRTKPATKAYDKGYKAIDWTKTGKEKKDVKPA